MKRTGWGRLASRTPTLAVVGRSDRVHLLAQARVSVAHGSTKDRVAAFILLQGIEAGLITERTLVVEASTVRRPSPSPWPARSSVCDFAPSCPKA
jgi:hypothetical protein